MWAASRGRAVILLIGLLVVAVAAAAMLEWRARSPEVRGRRRKTARGLASMLYVVIGVIVTLIALAFLIVGDTYRF